jgi:hypothetical protein
MGAAVEQLSIGIAVLLQNEKAAIVLIAGGPKAPIFFTKYLGLLP